MVDEHHADSLARAASGAARPARRSPWDRARRPARRAAGASAGSPAPGRRRRGAADRRTARAAARSANAPRSMRSSAKSTSMPRAVRRGAIASTTGDHQRGVSAATSRFSCTLRSSNSSTDWNVRPIPARARWWARSPSMRRPPSAIAPLARRHEPGERVDRGRLAGTVGPDEAHDRVVGAPRSRRRRPPPARRS